MSTAGGNNCQLVGECFIKKQPVRKFSGRVIVVKDLSRLFIPGVAMQRGNRIGMAYSTDGRHFITIKGEVSAQSCQSTVEEPFLKPKIRSY